MNSSYNASKLTERLSREDKAKYYQSWSHPIRKGMFLPIFNWRKKKRKRKSLLANKQQFETHLNNAANLLFPNGGKIL